MNLLKLSSWRFGLACGIVAALCVALITIAGIYGFLGGFPSLTLIVEELYGSIYYRISWLGVLIGAGYGFVSGFILAFIFSLIYNLFIRD